MDRDTFPYFRQESFILPSRAPPIVFDFDSAADCVFDINDFPTTCTYLIEIFIFKETLHVTVNYFPSPIRNDGTFYTQTYAQVLEFQRFFLLTVTLPIWFIQFPSFAVILVAPYRNRV